MQTYVSLDIFKGDGVTNVTRDKNDARMLATLEAASRQLGNRMHRRLYPVIDTRYPRGNGSAVMKFPNWDLISVTTLKEDTNGDGTYDTTWATTDYELAPYEHDPTDLVDPEPYWKLEVNQRSNGTKTRFGQGQKRFELVGVWGFCNRVVATGTTINDSTPMNATVTILTVADGSLVDVGDTLVIESEYLYVSGQAVSESNDFTVVRGVNGSTAATHADSTVVSRLVYPEPVVQAVIMEASQSWSGRTSGWTSRIDAEGIVTGPGAGLDGRILRQLDHYRRRTIA